MVFDVAIAKPRAKQLSTTDEKGVGCQAGSLAAAVRRPASDSRERLLARRPH